METLQPPRFDAPTPTGRIKQMEDWIFQFVQKYNYNLSETERQISQIKGDK